MVDAPGRGLLPVRALTQHDWKSAATERVAGVVMVFRGGSAEGNRLVEHVPLVLYETLAEPAL